MVFSLLGFSLAFDAYDETEGFIEDGALVFTAVESAAALYEFSQGC